MLDTFMNAHSQRVTMTSHLSHCRPSNSMKFMMCQSGLIVSGMLLLQLFDRNEPIASPCKWCHSALAS